MEASDHQTSWATFMREAAKRSLFGRTNDIRKREVVRTGGPEGAWCVGPLARATTARLRKTATVSRCTRRQDQVHSDSTGDDGVLFGACFEYVFLIAESILHSLTSAMYLPRFQYNACKDMRRGF